MSDSEKEVQTLKKPKTAYIHFCNDMRASVKDENSNLTPKEILSKLGELWQELKSDGGDNYKKYLDLAEEDKIRYQKQKEDNPNIEEKPRKKRETKKKSDEEKPKKPKKTKKEDSGAEEKKPRKLNGYLKFLQANRNGCKTNNPEFSSKQITSDLANKWRELSDEDKQKWKDS